MTTPAPKQRVSRVALRPASIEDAPLLKRWRSEASVRRYQPLHDVSTAQLRADVAAQRMADLYRGKGERFLWIIEADDRPSGWITLVVTNWEHGLSEIGYALSADYHSQGVMTQALSMLIPDLFFKAQIARIEARCADGNVASQRVLAKLGFVQEGVLRSYFVLHGKRVDHLLYSLLRSDYIPAS